MRAVILFLAAALAACSSTTGPVGHDPVVLATNNTQNPMTVAWMTANGASGVDTVPAFGRHCIAFTVVSDSLWMDVEAYAVVQGNKLVGAIGPGWFGPPATTVPFWTIAATWTAGQGSPTMSIVAGTTAPC